MASRRQADRQRTTHIGQAAGFGKWNCFSRNKYNTQGNRLVARLIWGNHRERPDPQYFKPLRDRSPRRNTNALQGPYDCQPNHAILRTKTKPAIEIQEVLLLTLLQLNYEKTSAIRLPQPAMPLSVEQFVQRYQASGLTDAQAEPRIQRLATAFVANAGEKQGDDDGRSGAAEFAKWLVQKGLLTRFQAQQILASDVPVLRIGDFLLRQKISSGSFDGCYLVNEVQPNGNPAQGENSSAVVVLKMLSHPLTDWQLASLRRYQEIPSPHLMLIEGPLTSPRGDFVIGRLPAGKFASEFLPDSPFRPKLASLVASDLMRALEPLHASGLTAVPDRIDRIWIGKDETAVLIVDPFPIEPITNDPVSNDARSAFQLLAPAEPLVAGQYRAPERTLDDSGPDPPSDLYAVGCLLYHLHFAEPPYPGLTAKKLATAQAKIPPRFIAAKSSADPAPLAENAFKRVLTYLLAKNRNARFASAADANLALLAAIASLPPDPIPQPAATKQPAEKTQPTDEKPPAAKEKPPAAKEKSADNAQPTANLIPAGKPEPAVKPVSTSPKMPAATPSVDTAKNAAAPSQPQPENSQPENTRATKKRTPVRRKKKKSLVGPMVLGGLGFVLMILIVLVLIRGNSPAPLADVSAPQPLPKPPATFKGSADRNKPAENAASPSGAAAETSPSGYQLVDDDRILWASPNTSASPALSMLPPGSPMIVSFRPDRIGPNGPAAQLFTAFSPELSAAWTQLENRVGMPLTDVDRISIAVGGVGSGQVTGALAVQLKAPTSIATLTKKWQADAAQTPSGATIYVSSEPAGDAYYFGSETNDNAQSYAIGDVDSIKRVAELEGAPIPLPPNLTDLWKTVGGDPDMAILATTNFLFADGRSMLENYGSRLSDPLRNFLIPDASGLAMRMDFSPQWFGELRLAPGGGLSPAMLKKKLDDQIVLLPETAEQFLLNTTPHPSWRALAIRLPPMMRAAASSMRTGIVDGNAVVNFYLPPSAAPNVLLATLLAANTPPGATATPTKQATNNAPKSLTTIEQLLATKFSVEFTQESLEMASQTVEDQFNSTTPTGSLPMNIILIGSDLQLEGITQNQQIRNFEHSDSTLQTVLDDLVRRANPDQTATELYQDAQKLLWVVAPDPSDQSKQAVLITVRSQAKKKNYNLPPQFVPPQ